MFDNFKIHLDYYIDGIKNSVDFYENMSNKSFRINVNYKAFDMYSSLKLSILPFSEIEIEKLYIVCDYKFKENDRIFVNGYQSWTDSREFFSDEKLRNISGFMKPLAKKYKLDKYGDYLFKKYSKEKGHFHGYTYSYIRNDNAINLIGSLTEKNGYTIIEENIKENKIIIEKECSGLFIKDDYMAFDLIWAVGSEDEAFDLYFKEMNIKKTIGKKMNGWTSWYNYYQDINQAIILENLNNFKALYNNIDIFQIDDGYQTAVGDWLSIDKEKFPNGMEYIAKSIKANGYKAGIWLAPFVCETNSTIFKDKNNWILRDDKGEMVSAGSNWSGFYALDIYNEEVRCYIKEVFDIILNDWGFDMVKLDFLYAACIIPTKYKTRGQIMTEAMDFLRECVKDKLILGCGVPLGPSFGRVDYCRIGCDVGLDYDDKFYMRFLHRERISTLNAMRNSIGRKHLDGRAFLNDPDVFLLRDNNIKLNKAQKHTLSAVNHIFGSLIFTSDDIKEYDPDKHLLFNNIMNKKEIKIKSTDCYKDGLVEVLYREGDINYLALINLGNRVISYKNNFNKLKEYNYSLNDNKIFEDCVIEIVPYESKIFIME